MAHVNSCTSPRVADNPRVSSVSLLSADSPIGEQVATGTHLRVEDSHLVNGLSQYVTWIKAVAPTLFLHLSLKHTLLSHSNTGAHVHLAATLQPKAVLSSLSSLIFQFLQCFFFLRKQAAFCGHVSERKAWCKRIQTAVGLPPCVRHVDRWTWSLAHGQPTLPAPSANTQCHNIPDGSRQLQSLPGNRPVLCFCFFLSIHETSESHLLV